MNFNRMILAWLLALASICLPRSGSDSVSLAQSSNVCVSDDKSKSYILRVLSRTNDRVFRFKKMPITVSIDSKSKLYNDACEDALQLWSTATQGLVRFEIVDAPIAKAQARVKVEFDNDSVCSMSLPGVHLDDAAGDLGDEPLTGGRTLLNWYPRRSLKSLKLKSQFFVPPQIVHIYLSILFKKPQSMHRTILTNVIAHEIGHALGILAHSENPSDLMYFQTDENSQLSTRDIETLRQLYKMKADVQL